VRDRHVDELLRSAMAGLHGWMQTSRPGDRVAPVRAFPTAGVGHLRETLSDLHPPSTPAPLTRADESIELLDADTRAWGGPHYRELEEHVAGLGDRFDLAAAFEAAADATRRPVDLVGLLEIAHRGALTEHDEISVVEALRPDGTTRRFAFGAVTASTTKDDDD